MESVENSDNIAHESQYRFAKNPKALIKKGDENRNKINEDIILTCKDKAKIEIEEGVNECKNCNNCNLKKVKEIKPKVTVEIQQSHEHN